MAANSAHYRGKALDVDRIHGIPVNASNPFYTAFESACFYYGASLILGPGDPGHDTHIHCAWP
jgi:zinc D-Ala-D-Ala carboxypeptidase